jgi:hypothetical protein
MPKIERQQAAFQQALIAACRARKLLFPRGAPATGARRGPVRGLWRTFGRSPGARRQRREAIRIVAGRRAPRPPLHGYRRRPTAVGRTEHAERISRDTVDRAVTRFAECRDLIGREGKSRIAGWGRQSPARVHWQGPFDSLTICVRVRSNPHDWQARNDRGRRRGWGPPKRSRWSDRCRWRAGRSAPDAGSRM